MSDFGSNVKAVLSDSENTKEYIPNAMSHETTFRGHGLAWCKDYILVDGAPFHGGFVEALAYIGTLPKIKPRPADRKTIAKIADLVRTIREEIRK